MKAMPTMEELYPGGCGYHQAHEAYIDAVAAALDAAGFPTADWYADPNDPRDGAIQLDLTRQGTIDGTPVWQYDEVWVGWQEERGWTLLTVTEYDKPRFNKGNWDTDSRYVYDLPCALVASPRSVVLVVAEKAGLTLELPDDGHPDVEFDPPGEFGDGYVPLELALAHYAEPKPVAPSR